MNITLKYKKWFALISINFCIFQYFNLLTFVVLFNKLCFYFIVWYSIFLYYFKISIYFLLRLWYKSILFYFAKVTGIFYYSPSNTNYWWNFGAFALIFLIMQIITGVVLAMFYDANSELAFRSIIYINNEVYYGWWFRYMHSNGASFFFIVVYLHICRGIYYGSYLYPRQFFEFPVYLFEY